MGFKRTRAHDRIEEIVNKMVFHKTSKYVYTRYMPGAPLARMTREHWNEYIQSKGKERSEIFYKYAEFAEPADDI